VVRVFTQSLRPLLEGLSLGFYLSFFFGYFGYESLNQKSLQNNKNNNNQACFV